MNTGEIEIEADRIVNRLTTMPIGRIDEALIERVRDAAQQIVDLTPDPSRPPSASMPKVGASALGAQVAVAVRDYLDMRTAASDDAAVAKILMQLRRSLP
jgi:hypothetical protein